MADRFEAEQLTTVRTQRPGVPVARRVLLLAVAAWTLTRTFSLLDALRNIALWWASPAADRTWVHYPFFNTTSLVLHALAAAVLVSLVLEVRRWRAPRRSPGVVSADERGLHAGGALVAARADIASVEVMTDPDLGFEVAVTLRDGTCLRVPLRSEHEAGALAAALSPDRDGSRLVFEGVTDRRVRDTRRAVVAILVCVAAVALRDVAPDSLWTWLHVPNDETPGRLRWWIEWLAQFGPFVFGAPAVTWAAGRIVQRLRPGQVVVDAKGIAIGARRVPVEALRAVEAVDESRVLVTLREGKPVRLAFGADRPVVEREHFVARVRDLLAAPPSPSYPSAETSGVRVAASGGAGASDALTDEALTDEPEAIAPEPRVARRG